MSNNIRTSFAPGNLMEITSLLLISRGLREDTSDNIDPATFGIIESLMGIVSNLSTDQISSINRDRESTIPHPFTDHNISTNARGCPGLAMAFDIGNLEKSKRKYDSCTICLEDFTDDTHIAVLPCGHYFCVACINNAFNRTTLCPNCRADALA